MIPDEVKVFYVIKINTDFNPVESIEVRININNIEYSFFLDIINQYDNRNKLFIGKD